jgi:lambda repressor-like predicted transcriptional regulator
LAIDFGVPCIVDHKITNVRLHHQELGLNKGTGVDYGRIADRHLDDDRQEMMRRLVCKSRDAQLSGTSVSSSLKRPWRRERMSLASFLACHRRHWQEQRTRTRRSGLLFARLRG